MKTVAVLRGGLGNEHEVSLKTGATVLNHLEDRYHIIDVFIDRAGLWHVRGIPKKPEQVLAHTDAVFNALHGQYGEDGEVQRLLERLGVPYTGSNALASALAMNKCQAKELMRRAGISTPHSITLSVSPNLDADILAAFRSFPQPSVIKPARSGSSVGVTLARTFDEFSRGVKEAFAHSKEVLVEEFIKGKEATVGIIDALRGKDRYVLPPVEIITSTDSFFDYEAKYGGATEERCPGNFSKTEMDELAHAAETAHTTLGLRHYSRSDYIVTPHGVYFLETNTLPGLTETSLLPQSLAAVGVTLPEFLDHIIDLATKK